MQDECAGGRGLDGHGPALQQSGVPASAPQQQGSRLIVEVDGDVEVVTVRMSGMEVEEVESEVGGSVESGAGGSGGRRAGAGGSVA